MTKAATTTRVYCTDAVHHQKDPNAHGCQMSKNKCTTYTTCLCEKSVTLTTTNGQVEEEIDRRNEQREIKNINMCHEFWDMFCSRILGKAECQADPWRDWTIHDSMTIITCSRMALMKRRAMNSSLIRHPKCYPWMCHNNVYIQSGLTCLLSQVSQSGGECGVEMSEGTGFGLNNPTVQPNQANKGMFPGLTIKIGRCSVRETFDFWEIHKSARNQPKADRPARDSCLHGNHQGQVKTKSVVYRSNSGWFLKRLYEYD